MNTKKGLRIRREIVTKEIKAYKKHGQG